MGTWTFIILFSELLFEIEQKKKKREKKSLSVFIWRHIPKKGNVDGYTQFPRPDDMDYGPV